jgi:hypothetical protein
MHLTGKTDVIEILEVAPRQEDDSGDAYPNGLIAEIEEIKRRIDSLEEERRQVLRSIGQTGRNQGV